MDIWRSIRHIRLIMGIGNTRTKYLARLCAAMITIHMYSGQVTFTFPTVVPKCRCALCIRTAQAAQAHCIPLRGRRTKPLLFYVTLHLTETCSFIERRFLSRREAHNSRTLMDYIENGYCNWEHCDLSQQQRWLIRFR